MGFTHLKKADQKIHKIEKSIKLGENNNQKYDVKELTFLGKNYGSEYRVFLDYTNDNNLSYRPNAIDYLIGKGSKDTWYEHFVNGITINTTDYATSKSDFLKKYAV
ncbi:hypothetical protein CK556_02415 [Mesoplasma chauliocola]|uniref:Uncharacterized protein n=2 Tax=Mesoplasma chauliocola TaxID=216427 RepID=A0A249SNG9_9MOLU|nr:hypothetical protein CK556_02415 [Mesoplasma chauliocola]